jgi:hypothetical protein
MDLVALLTCIKHTTTTTTTTTNINYLLFCAGKTASRPITAQKHKKHTNKYNKHIEKRY